MSSSTRVKLLHRDRLIAHYWLGRPPAHFSALTTGGSQQLMRHFISKSLIMEELQPQHEVEPQLLNGGDFNEEREDADASESVKKRRRKKKRKTSTAGKKHHFVVGESLRKQYKLSPLVPLNLEHERQICGAGDFSTCQRVFWSSCPTLSGCCWS